MFPTFSDKLQLETNLIDIVPRFYVLTMTSLSSDDRNFILMIVCQKCYDYYMSGEIKEGDDGIDEQCRWCGDGGKLVGCDYCHNAYCKSCIKSNLGSSELTNITGLLRIYPFMLIIH